MNQLKKVLCITAVLSLLVTGVLTGCTQKSGTGTTEKETTTTKAPEQTTAKPELKPVTLKWYVFGTKQADHDKVMAEINKKLDEKIKVTLDLQVLDAGTFNDKLKMIVASGEKYDLTFTSSWRNNFHENVAKGAFMAMDEFLPEAPLLEKTLGSSTFNVARVAGKLYAIPNYQIMYSQWGFFIQKELLDKYKFDINSIKNFYDIEPFLESIKKNEPDLIPYRSGSVLPDRNYEVYNFSTLNGFVGYKKGDTSLKVFDHWASNLRKEEALASKDFFEKGYIRKDILTVTDDSADRKANKYAVYNGTYKPGGDAEASKIYGKEYVAVPYQKPYNYYQAGIATMTAVSQTSEDPGRAVKFLELINTDKEIFNMLLWGIENTHYTKISDQVIEPVKDTKYSYGTSAWMLGNQFNSFYLPTQKVGVWEETDKINKSAESSVFMGFTINQAPIQAEMAQLSAVQKEYNKIEFLPDFEKKFNERYEKLKAAGVDKVVEEVQKQVDAWAKANGKK